MTDNKKTVLIADDSEMNQELLKEILHRDFNIIQAMNGKEAIEILHEKQNEIDLFLLDIIMPEIDGFDVLQEMNDSGIIDVIPVIMISSESSSSYINHAYDLGATDYITRPFNQAIVRRRAMNTIMISLQKRELLNLVSQQVQDRVKNESLMVNILSHIVEFRNGESALHILHINQITEVLLEALNKEDNEYHFSSKEISNICMASSLHDVGKIAIPENILNKPGRLTKEEFDVIKTHSMIGASMLESLHYFQDEPLLQYAYAICRWHHERFDGRGYPDGLSGNSVPIYVQIVSIADVYDALTSKRVYKPAYSHEKAIEMILNGECGTFNPLLLDLLIKYGDIIHETVSNEKFDFNDDKRIKKLTNDIVNNNTPSNSSIFNSDQILMVENKFADYMSMANMILFDYTLSSKLLNIFPAIEARRLGLKQMIMDPINNVEVISLVGKDTLEFVANGVRNCTRNFPNFETNVNLKTNTGDISYHLVIKTNWGNNEYDGYTDFIGYLHKND